MFSAPERATEPSYLYNYIVVSQASAFQKALKSRQSGHVIKAPHSFALGVTLNLLSGAVYHTPRHNTLTSNLHLKAFLTAFQVTRENLGIGALCPCSV
jgi:hypothetical protein